MFGLRVENRKDGGQSDSAFVLALIYTLGFFGFIGCLFFVPVQGTDNSDIIKQLVPVLSMIQGGIVQFFYQKSTQDREAKANQTIKELATTATTVAASAAGIPLNPAMPGIPPGTGDIKTDNLTVTSENTTVNESEKK